MTGSWEIKQLLIQPALIGKGAFKVLIHDSLKKAHSKGYDQAILSTWHSSVAALALYKAFDFLPVPSFKTLPNSELIFLGRSLSAADAQTLS
jgi:ribosomal protein S18 acetylase RimI-like enzyme